MNQIAIATGVAATMITAAYEKAVADGVLPEAEVRPPAIEIPKDVKNGDYATGFAMQNAKLLSVAPRKAADEIIARLVFDGTCFERAEAAGPGFINLHLNHGWFESVLLDIAQQGKKYGNTQVERPERIMVEFVSANPTGPMHMGNARGGVLGDTIAEVLSRAGHSAYREFLVNDAGNQIEKFAQSINARYMQLVLGEDAFTFPEDGYHGDDIKQLAQSFFDAHGDTYKDKDETERKKALTEHGLGCNLPRMKSDLQRYKIEYDNWFFESSIHEDGYVAQIVKKLVDGGHTYEKDGALWLKTSLLLTDFYTKQGKKPADIEKLELKDDVLCRANGFYTYFAADIAYHSDKLDRRGFDKAINIWGADHHGHVARLKCALDAIGLDGTNRLEIVLMQMVRLMRDGETVRMSKRTGKTISLSDLLDEISTDAARYFFNSRAADTHLEFDLGLAVRQDGENPIYYVQYAHARICSILKALNEAGINCEITSPDLALLTHDAEIELIRELSRLPEEIRLAALSREPSRLNKYAVSVATAFHRFYTSCRIKDAQTTELMGARIYLAKCTATVISNTLEVLGVTAPDHM